MQRWTVVACLASLSAGLALGQGNLQWQTDARRAVAQARQSRRPLMVYLRHSVDRRCSGGSCRSSPEDQHADTFRDPRVQRWTARFIPLRLTGDRDRLYVSQFGFSKPAQFAMVFVSPDGKALAHELNSSGLRSPEAVIDRLKEAWDAWGEDVFETELRTRLESGEVKPAELRAALKTIAGMRIGAADTTVMKLLSRDSLDLTTRRSVCETLAAISTPAAVAQLLELAHGGDRVAVRALERCTPVGAEHLLDVLDGPGALFDYTAYRAIVRIAGIRDAKSQRYFEQTPRDRYARHLESVRASVLEQSRLWRAENG